MAVPATSARFRVGSLLTLCCGRLRRPHVFSDPQMTSRQDHQGHPGPPRVHTLPRGLSRPTDGQAPARQPSSRRSHPRSALLPGSSHTTSSPGAQGLQVLTCRLCRDQGTELTSCGTRPPRTASKATLQVCSRFGGLSQVQAFAFVLAWWTVSFHSECELEPTFREPRTVTPSPHCAQGTHFKASEKHVAAIFVWRQTRPRNQHRGVIQLLKAGVTAPGASAVHTLCCVDTCPSSCVLRAHVT